MKGALITTIDRVMELSMQRKAVVWRDTKPIAAAFFIGWPVRTLYQAIQGKHLYEYITPKQ